MVANIQLEWLLLKNQVLTDAEAARHQIADYLAQGPVPWQPLPLDDARIDLERAGQHIVLLVIDRRAAQIAGADRIDQHPQAKAVLDQIVEDQRRTIDRLGTLILDSGGTVATVLPPASAGLPQLGANAAYARTHNSPLRPGDRNVFEAGFDASWEIDVFGGVRRDKEAALADVQAAEEGRREVLVTLLADVGRSYLELRGTQQQLRILEETLAAEQDTLDIAAARLEAGLGAELDVARAEGLLKANEADRPVLERQIREAIYRLGVLVGKEPGAFATELETPSGIPPVPPEIPLTLPSELLSRRPDLKRAERELAAATARIGVARADLFPRFSILGSFGRRTESIGDFGKGAAAFWNVVPAVRWPIFAGGRIRANIEVRDARQEQALLQYEKQILTALEEVETALSAHTRERSREASLRAAVDSTRRALALATDRYTSGLENFLSVLDAERSVYAAEDQLAQAKAKEELALLELQREVARYESSERKLLPWVLGLIGLVSSHGLLLVERRIVQWRA
jgi:NodT family efflux transporter outer membrane factor (OMF) lipoprotein